MRKLIYLVYYLKKLDINMLRLFLRYASVKCQRWRISLLLDAVISSIIYNISLLEYFQFKFYEIERKKRKTYAGTGYMYEYQLIMNPKKDRVILNDKTRFYRNYQAFIKHKIADIEDLNSNSYLANAIINNPAGKIVFKIYDGQCGRKILIKSTEYFRDNDLVKFMKENGYDLAEEFIIQHHMLSQLSPSGVNTVRIYTQLNSYDQFEILGCRLRISVDSIVDNMAAGNIAAPIDEHTGMLTGPGVYGDITKSPEYFHPITGVPLVGFQIPYWKETIQMTEEASLLHPQNRSIGWDIAITENGPDLIEGNHDWCKLVWQLPVNKGLKPILEKHLYAYRKSK